MDDHNIYLFIAFGDVEYQEGFNLVKKYQALPLLSSSDIFFSSTE